MKNYFKNRKKLFSVFDTNKNLIYLDSAKTCYLPKSVEKIYKKRHLSLQNLKANLYYCKVKITKLLKCRIDEIFFVPQGTTCAINYIALTLKKLLLKQNTKTTIVTTQAEHHANYLPWLAHFQNVEILPLDTETKKISSPSKEQLQKTFLLTITAKSNVLGNLWNKNFFDLKKLINNAHSQKTLVMIDGAQVALDPNFNLKKVAADIFVFSAHKVYGPKNLGILFISKKLQSLIPGPKQNIETLPLTAINTFNQTLKFIRKRKIAKDSNYQKKLAQKLTAFLKQFSFVKIISNDHSNIITFFIDDIHAHDLCDLLGQQNIIVRAGNHCAKPLHDALQISSTIRISFGYYNDEKDIIAFKKGFIAACHFLGKL